MFHGLIGLKFREESDRDLFWTRVDSCWLVPDWCWLVLDSRWFVLTRVGLVLDSYWFVLTRVELVLTRVNSCWLVLTPVDLCWYSCIRTDLIQNSPVERPPKFLVERNPPQSWPWKQNGTTVVGVVMILEVMNNWRSELQINILKKQLDFEP